MSRKTKAYHADILIAGGGIAGLALAVILGKAGLKISIIDPAPPASLKDTKPSARTIALMQSSLNILKSAGLEEIIEKYGNPLRAMRIIDDSAPGREKIDTEFPANDIGLAEFGYNVPNSILRAALYEASQKIKTITLHIPGVLKNYRIEENHALTTLEDGAEIQSSLIVGADGRGSKVRKIAGIDCKTKDYNQSAVTCIVGHSKSHNDTATEFHRGTGPLAFVPMSGNQCAVVWVESTDYANKLLKLRKDELLATLQKRSNGILGTLTLDSNPESWPLQSLRAESLTAPRTVLIAEAAHVMSPITAQGLNLSLRDVGALAETVADFMRAGLDIGSTSALKKYETRRAADIHTRTFGVDGMNSIVSTDASFIKTLRRRGLKTVSAITPLKKLAMQYGLAPDIDLGRLAKGEAL